MGDYVYWAHEDGEFWPGVGQVTGCDKSNHSFKVAFRDFHKLRTGTKRWNCEANSLYKCKVQDWHNHFSGYEDEGVTHIEYGKSRKLTNLKRALRPTSIKTSKHGPSFDSAQANKYVYKGQLINMGKIDVGHKPKKIRWREGVPKRVLLKAIRANWASSCVFRS